MNDELTARMLRFEVPVDDQWHTITVPAMARFKLVAARDPKVLEFWAEQWDGEGMTRDRTFRVFGTGQPYDPRGLDHIGTTLAAGGSLVWHLFEQVKP